MTDPEGWPKWVEDALALTLYPHYSNATTGSSLRELSRALDRTGFGGRFRIRTVDRWYDDVFDCLRFYRRFEKAAQTETNHLVLLAETDEWIVDAAVTVAEQNRQEVADIITQTIAGWDPDATVYRIELAVGRDLQFVRINGTLVGGFVGLAIYTVYRALH